MNVTLASPGNVTALFVMINETSYNNPIMLRLRRQGLELHVSICNKSLLSKDNCCSTREEKETQLSG